MELANDQIFYLMKVDDEYELWADLNDIEYPKGSRICIATTSKELLEHCEIEYNLSRGNCDSIFGTDNLNLKDIEEIKVKIDHIDQDNILIVTQI